MSRVQNKEVAAVFHEMADLLLIRGGNPYRVRAFQRSARVIENLGEPIENMLRFGTLEKQPGVGEGTVHRVKQILRTGTCDEHRELRSLLPAGLRDMLEVKGIGARTARLIWQYLRIGTIDELEIAARGGALHRLPRVGDGTVQRILAGIAAWRLRRGRVALVESQRLGQRLVDALRTLPEVQRITLAGSVRRGKATIGDMDILVASESRGLVASRFVKLPQVEEILIQGTGRCQVRLHNRQTCDLRVIPVECWGAGLHYFTGAKLHNIQIRARGNHMGLKISDKGIFRKQDDARIRSGMTEEEIFAAVGLPFIPPELRENLGEVEAAADGKLPHLVTASDLRGDLHMHTTASDGKGTIEDMARAAAKMGHEYIAITDHTSYCSIANGQEASGLAAQLHYIRSLGGELHGVRILAGVEVDILPDGRLDIDLDLLRQLDWVIASCHSHLDMGSRELTDRYIAAMRTGVVDCLGHPTNRRLGHREASSLDMERLLEEARRADVAVEVNGNPHRMDLPDVGCRMAREYRVPVCINTDSHAPEHLVHQEFGLLPARRGWLEPHHVLNTRPWEEISNRRRQRLGSAHAPVVAANAPRPVPRIADDGHDSGWRAVGGESANHQEEISEIENSLRIRPLPDPLAERLQRWLASGDDPPLEEALRALGDEPMQVAFGLLAGQ